LVLLNMMTYTARFLYANDEMQANSYWEKMLITAPQLKLAAAGKYVLTYAVWRDQRSFIEQVDIPDLFFRALMFESLI